MAKSQDLFSNLNFSDKSFMLEDEFSFSSSKEKPASAAPDSVVKLSDLREFTDHPFKVDTETPDFEELVESIRDNGLIYPILVRPVDDKYEIISGHRRVEACKSVGLEEIPVIIRPLNDYEATIVMVHSNLYRPEISISERAKAYRMCMDAEKHQGKKGADTAVALGEEASDSRAKVYRYIRLSYLSEELLDCVDIKKLTIGIGVELSYIDEIGQGSILTFIEQTGTYPNFDQACALRKTFEDSNALSFE